MPAPAIFGILGRAVKDAFVTTPFAANQEDAVALTQVDHFLIQTADLGKTRDWYVRTLGMTEGWHPDFKFPVVWLYIGEKDVLHLTEGGANVSANRKQYLGQQSEAVSGSGVVDHIAFRANGLRDTMSHLRSLGWTSRSGW